MISLVQIDKHNSLLRYLMQRHYSQPKGFVGRSLCYLVMYSGLCYGCIVAGSATKHLPCDRPDNLNQIVSNVFYSVSPVDGKYPTRNFTSAVVKAFVDRVCVDWRQQYGDEVLQFETLVLPPRTGALYTRAGWSLVGKTQGYSCRRVAGEGFEKWGGGRRVWSKGEPKLVFSLKVSRVRY